MARSPTIIAPGAAVPRRPALWPALYLSLRPACSEHANPIRPQIGSSRQRHFFGGFSCRGGGEERCGLGAGAGRCCCRLLSLSSFCCSFLSLPRRTGVGLRVRPTIPCLPP